MDFDYKPLVWSVEGVEPPDSVKNEGWLAGHRPPSAYFNYKWRADYLTQTELQQKLSNLYAIEAQDKASLEAAMTLKAPIDSPEFTGTPKAPTPVPTSNSTELATTEWVKTIVSGIDLSGVQKNTIFVSDADLNTLLGDQAYICTGTLSNTPISTTYCIMRGYDTSSTERIVQVCYVPDLTTNAVRTFVRAVNGGTTFGTWQELATASSVNKEIDVLRFLLNENKFRNKATLAAMNKAVFNLFIETFETLDDVDKSAGSGETAITAAYDADKHIFTNTVEGTTLTFQSTAKEITGPNDTAWCYPDWEQKGNSDLVISMSRDGGTTWTTVYSGLFGSGHLKEYVASLADQPTGVQVMVKVSLVGVVTLKNLAWGVK